MPGLYTVGLGYKISDWRLEFNFSNSTVNADSVKITSGGSVISSDPNFKQKINSYMAYGYKDLTNDSKFTPYAGIGVGMASVSTNNLKTSFLDLRQQIIDSCDTYCNN